MSVYRQCRATDVAFFFKQWGGVQKHRTGREFLGRTFDEYPAVSLRTVAPITLPLPILGSPFA